MSSSFAWKFMHVYMGYMGYKQHFQLRVLGNTLLRRHSFQQSHELPQRPRVIVNFMDRALNPAKPIELLHLLKKMVDGWGLVCAKRGPSFDCWEQDVLVEAEVVNRTFNTSWPLMISSPPKTRMNQHELLVFPQPLTNLGTVIPLQVHVHPSLLLRSLCSHG